MARETNTDAADGFTEGVKVHGQWTIEVLEPDGTLVTRLEFENALIRTGKVRIAEMLSRGILPRYWGITLRHSLLELSPCLLTATIRTACQIQEPQSPIVADYIYRTLVVSMGDFSGVLTLRGTATAQIDGQVTSVTTTHKGRLCGPGEFPNSCSGANAGTQITMSQIPTAIDVAEGQIMSVTVEISFE